ncbi:hypothetical protein [Rugamonas aquatica]|uniref:Uncharacterized protein n=1 Tax=Rugamonas aquatica TaxID=2743357 RepID=A0A6A7NAX4_9BURK|nr:hypothetical protein [Rugamonas aquatica]MQA42320.1 hypothetical protein [Rugamonas aquatica]
MTQYVMSCRVLGMEIEVAVLRAVVALLRGAASTLPIMGLVLNTDKNTPSRGVFASAGFQATSHPQLFLSKGPPPATPGAHVQLRWA